MHAAQLARLLGAKKSGRQYFCRCPAHDDTTPSLIFWDGHTSIRFKCFSGCEPLDIIDALRKRGLWDGTRTNGDATSVAAKPKPQSDANGARSNRDFALSVWRASEPLLGSPADRYLRGRGLALPMRGSGVARFHPACPRGQERAPALIVLFRSLSDGIPCAIQRIYLTRDCKKDGKPMMLGPTGDAAMKLAPAGSRLYVCEGFETALAAEARGFAPVWALGSAGAIERFPVLDGIDQLVIVADHDPVGIAAAEACFFRWGERARIKKMDREGADFADLASEQSKR